MKKRLVVTIVVCAMMLILSMVIMAKNNKSNSELSGQTCETYFLNPSTKSLDLEKRILQSTELDDKVNEVLNILLVSGSTNKSLKPLTTQPIKVEESYVEESSAVVKFGTDYEMLNNIDKIYLKASIVWSLTSIDGIDSVIFYVNDHLEVLESITTPAVGNENVKFDRSYVLLDPVIDPINSILINVQLFFVNEKNGLLNLEQRQNVYANPNTSKEYYVVDELIKGTSIDGLTSYIPKSTKIINVETDNKICYVNLSEDFVTKQTNDDKINRLSIYQIVNSLTMFEGVDGVQILIDSKKSKGFKNGIDLSEVLTGNEDYNNEFTIE